MANNNHPIVLGSSGKSAATTGGTVEVTLATIPVPQDMMGTSGFLRVTTQWSMTNNANAKTLSVYLGTKDFEAFAGASLANKNLTTYIWNNDSFSAQVGGTASLTGTQATGTNLNLTIRATPASAGDTITLLAYSVEVVNG